MNLAGLPVVSLVSVVRLVVVVVGVALAGAR